LLILGEDATGAGEATTQSWAWEELVALVGEETASALGATEAGNVDADEDLEGHHSGKNVLKASVLTTASPSMLQALTKLHKARTNRHDARVDSVATAGAHGLILHAFRRSAAELENSDHGAVAEQIELALREKFGVGTETFSRIAGADVLATPEDYVLVGLGLGDNAMADEADQRFFDDELGLYYVTVEPVLEVRPLWWPSSPGDLPAPTVWRVASGGAPELMVAEIAAPFENPDMPPAGAVLLALKLANED
jgi:uncharacterized protein YyaL (SSP411 family)